MEKYLHKLPLPLKLLAIILVIACTTLFAHRLRVEYDILQIGYFQK
jgi:hypothetical protein